MLFLIEVVAALSQQYHLRHAKKNRRVLLERKHDLNAAYRIVGGHDAPKGLFPHQVAILSSGLFQVCGGALIWYDLVASAAHCTSMAENVAIGRNSNSTEEILKICKRVIYPSTSTGNSNDIAIYQLCTPSKTATVDDFVMLNNEPAFPVDNQALVVSGWGATSEGGTSATTLQQVEVQYIPNDECNKDYMGAVSEDMMCAGMREGGKDACQGDSGGPIVIPKGDGSPNQHILVGIVSWGSGCARPGFPGVYARISHFAVWIKIQADLLSARKPVKLKFSSEIPNSNITAPLSTNEIAATPEPSLTTVTTTKPESFTNPQIAAKPETTTTPQIAAKPETTTTPQTAAKPESSTTSATLSNIKPPTMSIDQSQSATNNSPEPSYADLGNSELSRGCCWSIDKGGCSKFDGCNENEFACLKFSLCGNIGKKYILPGQSVDPPVFPQSASATANALSSPKPPSTTSLHSNSKVPPEQCCWVPKLNRCLNHETESPACSLNEQTCKKDCGGTFFDHINNV